MKNDISYKKINNQQIKNYEKSLYVLSIDLKISCSIIYGL